MRRCCTVLGRLLATTQALSGSRAVADLKATMSEPSLRKRDQSSHPVEHERSCEPHPSEEHQQVLLWLELKHLGRPHLMPTSVIVSHLCCLENIIGDRPEPQQIAPHRFYCSTLACAASNGRCEPACASLRRRRCSLGLSACRDCYTSNMVWLLLNAYMPTAACAVVIRNQKRPAVTIHHASRDRTASCTSSVPVWRFEFGRLSSSPFMDHVVLTGIGTAW